MARQARRASSRRTHARIDDLLRTAGIVSDAGLVEDTEASPPRRKGGHGENIISSFPSFLCGGEFSVSSVRLLPILIQFRRLEGPMRAMLSKLQPGLLSLAMFAVLPTAASAQTPATGVTVFEGARVIVGDGRAPIENASFVVSGARFTQVGRAGEVRVPAAATRVSLAGKT